MTRLLRGLLWASLVLAILSAAGVAWVRAKLPEIATRQTEIAVWLERKTGLVFHAERVDAYWNGWHPGLRAFGMDVRAPGSARTAVRLAEMRMSLDWLPLVVGKFRINSLTLVAPRFTLERMADGGLNVIGLAPMEADPEIQKIFLDWLLRQREIVLEDGAIGWLDVQSGEALLPLEHTQLSLRRSNGRQRLRFTADFPDELCRRCELVASVRGNPFTEPEWDGQIHVETEGLRLAALPGVLRDRIAGTVEGVLTARLWSQWRDGRPVGLHGRAALSGLSWRDATGGSLALNGLSGEVDWEGDAPGVWQLKLRNFQLGLVQAPWETGPVTLERAAGDWSLKMGHLPLSDLDAFLHKHAQSWSLPSWTTGLAPRGRIEALALSWQGTQAGPPWQRPAESGSRPFKASLAFKELAFAPTGSWPGANALSGRLRADEQGGHLTLKAGAGMLSLPKLFADPLPVGQGRAEIDWEREDKRWRVHARPVEISSADGEVKGNLSLDLADDPALGVSTDMQFRLRRGRGNQAARYYPLILSEGLRGWLARSIVSGQVVEAEFALRGPLAAFPYRNGEGTFEVRAGLHDAVFDYLPGWPRIEKIDGMLLFQGPGMRIEAHQARLGGLAAKNLVVTAADFSPATGDPRVRVVGDLDGSVAGLLAALAQAKRANPEWAGFSYLTDGLKAQGEGALHLDLDIPAHDPTRTTLRGRYTPRRASLIFPWPGLGITRADGWVDFDHHGPAAGHLGATWLGGPATLDIRTVRAPGSGSPPEVVYVAKGTVQAGATNSVFGPATSNALRGHARWAASLRSHEGVMDWTADADLAHIASRLPAPLDKPGGRSAHLQLKSTATTPGSLLLELTHNGQSRARLAFARGTDRAWHFAKGHLGIGETWLPWPDVPGMQVSVTLTELDLAAWWRWFSEVRADSRSAPIPVVHRLVLKLKQARFGRTRMGPLQGDFRMEGDRFGGQVQGDAISGQILVGGHPYGINLALERLSLDLVREMGQGGTNQGGAALDGAPTLPSDPASMPALNVLVRNLEMGGRSLGTLVLDARPAGDGFSIPNLRLTHPQGSLVASGLWSRTTRGTTATALTVKAASGDAGAMVTSFGFPGELADGKGDLEARLSWPGGPGDYRLATLSGQVQANLKKGRLLKVEQGAGRMFGVLDVASIARYLTLDFSNIFARGFVFDDLDALWVFHQGVARANRMAIIGPSARVNIEGEVDFAQDRLDLSLEATPKLGEELAVGGLLLGGPVVGVATVVARDLLAKPLERASRVRYQIKGSLTAPEISRFKRQNSQINGEGPEG